MTALEFDAVDLDLIAESGQCFRWQRIGDGRYAIPLGGGVYEARQLSPTAVIFSGPGDEEAVAGAMRAYFDWGADYASLTALADGDDYLRAALAHARGLRILRQPLWETLCSFIVSQNNNIPRIRGILERLCGGALSPFPGPEAVRALGEAGLRALGTGYRAPYLLAAAERFSEAEARALCGLGYAQARSRLCGYTGVGGKVADCVCLFALGHKSAFPRDVWMKRVLAEQYPEGFPLLDHPQSGVLQQAMFVYARALAKRC